MIAELIAVAAMGARAPALPRFLEASLEGARLQAFVCGQLAEGDRTCAAGVEPPPFALR